MSVSVFDLFSIGIGPSSSHTVGPMRAAARFARALADDGLLERTTRVRSELFGSLGATGHGHGSYNAVLWGLEGEDPETVDVVNGPARTAEIVESGRLRLDQELPVAGPASPSRVSTASAPRWTRARRSRPPVRL